MCERYYVAREEEREALAARIMHAMEGTEPDVALKYTDARSSIGAAIEAVTRHVWRDGVCGGRWEEGDDVSFYADEGDRRPVPVSVCEYMAEDY